MIHLLEALTIGVFAALTVLYTFQTRVPYPKWILQAYDKPWIICVMLVVALSICSWNQIIGVMLLLFICALIIDGLIFANASHHSPSSQITPSYVSDAVKTNTHAAEVWPYDKPSTSRFDDSLEGPSLQSIPLPEPTYPMFMGLNDLSPGPAPF